MGVPGIRVKRWMKTFFYSSDKFQESYSQVLTYENLNLSIFVKEPYASGIAFKRFRKITEKY